MKLVRGRLHASAGAAVRLDHSADAGRSGLDRVRTGQWRRAVIAPTGTELDRLVRVASNASVTLFPGPDGGALDARAVNLSMGGVFVRSNQLLTPGAKVELALDLPDGDAPMVAQAEVVWVRDTASDTE